VSGPVLVVVPTADRPAMLADAVAGVLAQTDPDWRLVVADDGAAPIGLTEPMSVEQFCTRTGVRVEDVVVRLFKKHRRLVTPNSMLDEDTAQIVAEEFESEIRLSEHRAAGWASDSRVLVARATTRTAGGARNAGIEAGSARWPGCRLVAFLDDDDLWEPSHLEASRAALAARPTAVFAHGAARTRSPDGSERPYHERGEGPLEGDVFHALLRRDVVATSTAVARLDAVRAAGGFRADLKNGQDWDLWLRLARLGEAAFVPETHVVYRVHEGNASRRMVVKAEGHARVLSFWWDRRHLLSPAERKTLRRELARRHRRHVRRLLAERSLSRRAVRRLAWANLERVPHLLTALAAAEVTYGVR
jgi:glycosyltransferase involved in cell wall biosynthesis